MTRRNVFWKKSRIPKSGRNAKCHHAIIAIFRAKFIYERIAANRKRFSRFLVEYLQRVKIARIAPGGFFEIHFHIQSKNTGKEILGNSKHLFQLLRMLKNNFYWLFSHIFHLSENYYNWRCLLNHSGIRQPGKIFR